MADIKLQAQSVKAERNGSGVVVELEDINPKDIVAELDEDDTIEMVAEIDEETIINTKGIGTLLGHMKLSDILNELDTSDVLNEIGERACREHFGIETPA